MRAFRCLLPVVFTLVPAAAALAAFPAPQGPVSDFASVLDPAAKTELSRIVQATRDRTSAEIAVVTVPSLDGMTVEEYANKLFAAWGIGKKGKDNGVLVLVAPSERKMRIEVGYGLEPVLPDGLAGDIIRTDFLPAFRANEYARGIVQGTRHVAQIVERNHALTKDERDALAPRSERPPVYLMTPFFALFVGLGAFALGVGFRTKTFFPIVWGGLFGGIPFGMSLVPFFNATPFVLVPLAALMAVLGYRKGGSAGWAKSLRGKSKGGAASSGWVMGASSGSSGGGSGSSGGGGFGGGSSGGGGASGSW